MVVNQANRSLCLSYAYDDIISSRWDFATEDKEPVY